MSCLAPTCRAPVAVPEGRGAFCAEHAKAPPGQRGGWLSAHKRKLRIAGGAVALDRQDRIVPGALVLDAHPVFKRLWVGSRPPVDRPLPEFTTLILAARENQPQALGFKGKVLRCPIDDGKLTQAEAKLVLETALEAVADYRAGGRILSTCHAGLNRSALVAAVVLVELTRASPAQIIERIRSTRNRQCLANHSFQAFLSGIPRNFGRSKV